MVNVIAIMEISYSIQIVELFNVVSRLENEWMENGKLSRKLSKIMKIFVITRIDTFEYTFKTDGLHSKSDRSSQQKEPSIKNPLFLFNSIAKTDWNSNLQ